MSRENVELVRRVFASAERRDAEATLALYGTEVEIDNTHGPAKAFIGGRSLYHGHDGLRTFFRDWYEAWDRIETELIELIDTGDQVVSVLAYRGRGRASGIEVEWPDLGGIWTVEDGKVSRVAWFSTSSEALEAAGLSDHERRGKT